MTDAARIAALGRVLGPDVLGAVQDLYRDRQQAFVELQRATAVDCAYGDDPRHLLDIYAPAGGAANAAMILWVHGGGFLRGEKSSAAHPFGAHVGRWAARHGMVGAVMNYRLAPDHGWPGGGEDVGAALDWLVAHAGRYGGDPRRIVAVGTSAGAVHVATHIRLRGRKSDLAGAVLLSGLYGFTPLDERDSLYYGAQEHYAGRSPREAMIETVLPLLLACSEFDPVRFQQEMVELLKARLQRHGTLPPAVIAAGHNHFSLACHLGAGDSLLANAMLNFVANVPSHDKEGP